MLREAGDRRIDLTHRMSVLGVIGADADTAERIDAWLAAGVDGLVVPTSSIAEAVCDRVDVPVAVEVSPGRIRFATGDVVRAVGPLDEVGPARIARLVDEILHGSRALIADDPASVPADRRVIEVMRRLLSARADEETT